MGDFSEHVLFGFLAAAVAGYVFKGGVSAGFFESLSGLLLLFVGSVLPDIDHDNSYIHRAIKSFLSISAAVLAFFSSPFKIHQSFVVSVLTLSVVYVGISKIRPRHRGFVHSPRFAVYASAAVISTTVLVFNSLIPGTAFAIGIASHLLLDREIF